MSNIHVGALPKEWEGWESYFVHFHDFVRLPTEKNRPVWSPRFTCFGNEWKVIILPGGHVEGHEGMISLFLWHCSNSDISVTFAASVKDRQTGGVVMKHLTTHKFEGRKTWGWAAFALRTVITAPQSNVLQHGTLTVDTAKISSRRIVSCKTCNSYSWMRTPRTCPSKFKLKYSTPTSSCSRCVRKGRSLPPFVRIATNHRLRPYQMSILGYFGTCCVMFMAGIYPHPNGRIAAKI